MAESLIRHRPAGRPSAAQLSRLASRLTERDRLVALDCYDHRVLTTEQLRRLHFRNLRVAQRRLGELYQLRVLERFRPAWQQGEGSTPYHWLLDQAGAQIVAELLELPLEELAWRRDRTYALASSTKLGHQVAVNEFFTRLAEDARNSGGALVEWWGERRVAAAFAGRLAPDGYGRIELRDASLALLLELDRGSEDHRRLQEKQQRYARELAHSELAREHPLILLLVPSAARGAHLRERLAHQQPRITVAVWTADSDRSPLELIREAAAARGARHPPPTS